MFEELSMAIIEKVKDYKKVNIYKRATIAKRTKVFSLTSAKDVQIQYDMHVFKGQDFRNMANTSV